MEKRIFIAINLPSNIKSLIKKRYLSFLEKKFTAVRLVPAKNLHLTLKFLGAIKLERINLLEATIKKALFDFSPFILEIKNLGGFPNFHRPKVIWLGLIDKKNNLKLINQRLNKLLKKEKFIFSEEDNFKAHITLARFKKKISSREKESLLVFKKELGKNSLGGFRVTNIDLMESQIKNEGPIYYLIKSFNLR